MSETLRVYKLACKGGALKELGEELQRIEAEAYNRGVEDAAKEATPFDLPSVVVDTFEAGVMTANGIRNKIRALKRPVTG